MRHETFLKAEASFQGAVKLLFIRLDWLLFTCVQIVCACILVVDNLMLLFERGMKLIYAGFCIIHPNLNICNMG